LILLATSLILDTQVHQMVIQGGAYAPEKLKANEVASMLLGDDDEDDGTGMQASAGIERLQQLIVGCLVASDEPDDMEEAEEIEDDDDEAGAVIAD
jgi:hypothetical protein